MNVLRPYIMMLFVLMMCQACTSQKTMISNKQKTPKDILGNPDYLAISYGGYRHENRDKQPTIDQLKEDMKILSVMGIKVLRTYNLQFDEASNLMKAISLLKQEDPSFEMYVMLGAWIDCKNAWTGSPDHSQESEKNAAEIVRAVALTRQYPDIIKVIAVGNEAMVKWAASYFVQPDVILKWVNHLQVLKQKGDLPKALWITSSDNFASWGGGGNEYHVQALNDLIKAVDYISMHTYPMHDTHYNPDFWGVRDIEINNSDSEKIDAAMIRARDYAITQYESVVTYMKSLGVDKPVHIGETGWTSQSNEFYGHNGSRAADEYKSGRYHDLMRAWTNKNNVACFYFEAFDEQWKDAANPQGSENHFGLMNLQGQAKYTLWDEVDKGAFKGLTRDGRPITKTYNGNKEALMKDVKVPPTSQEIKAKK